MSNADVLFKSMCENIIENGTTTKGQKVRPKWPDTGEYAYTIKQFGIVNKYDLRKEFPALTFRRTAIKSAMDEILWIFQKKSNNIHDLKPHIWDEWADENGSIGKAYGYQIGEVDHRFNVPHYELNPNDIPVSHNETKSATANTIKYCNDANVFLNGTTKFNSDIASFLNDVKNEYPSFSLIDKNVYLDQMDTIIYSLKHTPFDRRMITNLWNVSELSEMNLQPCCWSCTFNVTDEGGDKLVLNMMLNQRSNDVLAANNWNVVQYSLLLMMIAQVCNMEAGVLLHVIADAHIYDRHVDIVKELITRPMYDAPKVTLNPDINNFYDFTTNDITIENYITGPQVKNIPIAV